MNTKVFWNSTLLRPCTLYHWHTKVLSSWVVAILKHMCFKYTSTCKSKDTMVARCKESKRERQRKWEVKKVGERSIINSKERGKKKKRKRQREGKRKLDWTREKTNQSTRFWLHKWDFRPLLFNDFVACPNNNMKMIYFFLVFHCCWSLDLWLDIFRSYHFCGFLRFVKTLNPC